MKKASEREHALPWPPPDEPALVREVKRAVASLVDVARAHALALLARGDEQREAYAALAQEMVEAHALLVGLARGEPVPDGRLRVGPMVARNGEGGVT